MRNWGYERLHKRFREMSMGEMRDAEHLVRHILFLEGLPNLQRLNTVKIGESVEEDLRLGLESEMEACDRLGAAIEHCQSVGDHGTREMLEDMPHDEEEHVDWYETQMETIRQIGMQSYLSEQLRG